MKRLKVVWICHFSDPEIRSQLPLTKRRKYRDFAPWITNMVKGFEKREDVDLHIIAPHMGMTCLISHFVHNGINYHFFKPDVPIIHRRWPWFLPLDKWTGFLRNRLFVYFIVKKIKPDIIHLNGAENDYYSSTILWLKKLYIPVYVLIQGIVSDPALNINNGKNPNKLRIKIERKIHKEFTYFGIGAPFFCDLIKRDNANPLFLTAQAPRKIYINPDNFNSNKKFDFVFFARINQIKGIEDLLDAMSIVKQEKKDVSLNVIGSANRKYLAFLKQNTVKRGLNNNITFTGHLPTLNDVHKEALKAKFYVLPTKLEGMASSVIESMLLGLPVITCRTGGLPYLNKDGVTVLMSEPGDIKGLAENMISILNSPQMAKDLSIRAKEFAHKEFDIEMIKDKFIKQSNAIINHFPNGVEISKDLLFDEKHFKS